MQYIMRRCKNFSIWMLGLTILVSGLYGAEPDEYRMVTGPRFEALSPDHASRPAWLFATARGLARSADGTQDWVLFEWALDRTLPFHHLLIEILISGELSDLFIRLLDDQRQVISEDFMGNIADRIAGPGHVFLDLPLADQPRASVVQLVLPADEEPALHHLSVVPASYEILMKTAGDFVRGAQAWIRTPVYDPKNLDVLADLVLLDDGRLGDMTSPVSTFTAYGVDARPAEPLDDRRVHDDERGYLTTGFALDALPALARINVTVRHVNPLAPVEVWVNQQRAGRLSLNLPDLEEPAYWPSDDPGTWTVGRWTRGWFFIDHDLLRRGDNTIRIGQRSLDPEAPALEIIAPSLQFKYPWEEIATYPLLQISREFSPDRIVEGIDGAPWGTAQQEDDVFIVRADEAFRSIGHGTPTPAWLDAVEREQTSNRHRYIFRLHPDQTPHQLGLDVIYIRGRHARVQVDLRRGDEEVARDIFGELRLDSPYVQVTLPLLIPLHDYGADTVVLDVATPPGRPLSLSRFQLKAGWPSAVLAKGHFETGGSLIDLPYEYRSAYLPGEVVLPVARSGEAPDAETASRWVRHIPLQETGTWYGVETRILTHQTYFLGDTRNLYFAEWQVDLDDLPRLARMDLLVQHVNVIEGLEVRINGDLAGHLSLHLPSLHDANYMLFRVNRLAGDGQSLTSAQRYAIDFGPFARASLVFDGRLFRPGKNTVTIGKPPRLKGTNDHYAMKEIRLQLKFPWAKDL